MRRAYLDRARFLGDPDFVQMPLTRLLSKDYARTLAATIDPAKASSSAELGKDILTAPAAQEPDETTHFSVIDRQGMAVSNTYTLEGGYGSRVVVKGAGFILNNEMGDFNKNPGVTRRRRHHRHAGQPDRSGQADAQLDDAGDRLEGRQGGARSPDRPGGRTIINTVFCVVLAATEFGMNVRAAVDAPRMHHQWMPDSVTHRARRRRATSCWRSCRAMGHTGQRPAAAQGDANSIGVDAGGTAWGANDKRSPDGKASVARLTSTASRQ